MLEDNIDNYVFSRKKHYAITPERRRKRLRKRKGRRPKSTGYEKILADRLRLRGYVVEMQCRIAIYFVDIYLPELKTVIEVDGKGHSSGPKKKEDKTRTEFLLRQNKVNRVIRIKNHEASDPNFEIVDRLNDPLLGNWAKEK